MRRQCSRGRTHRRSARPWPRPRGAGAGPRWGSARAAWLRRASGLQPGEVPARQRYVRHSGRDMGERRGLTVRSIWSIVLSAHARSCMVAMGSTLVLGGGGQAGIAWITGLLAGLAEAGQDVTGADLGIGTSAGATVAAQLGGGLGLDELFARAG